MNTGGFEIVAQPTTYSEKRIRSLPDVQQAVRECQVALRGWYFPHIQRDAASSFAQGFQSVTTGRLHVERFRLYQSGLFAWKGAYWEDSAESPKLKNGRAGLSFIGAIWSFTEFFIFLSRLYERIAPDATIRARVTMAGCRGRQLAAYDPMVDFFVGEYISEEDVISQEREVQVVELRASHLRIAIEMVKHVFHVFNWMNPDDSMVASWQQKLVKRQY